MRIFIDTSAFIALEDRSDRQHPAAREFYLSLTPADRLFTSNYILDETATRLRYTIGLDAAVRFLETMSASRLVRILYVGPDLDKEALGVMKKFRDKRLSFTDCSTIALARTHGLDGVFAFDDDFAGLRLRLFPAG
ncbi:MAG: type II toxin-antitoxin system VapC family toxin [Elusimicrobia bacterium]|nr:type II toxin-antitoxin system VapC family toxin [Elusimicrobiota bacterium]